MNLIFDLWQQRQIQSAQKAAHEAVDKTRESRDDLFTLRRRIETLALTNQALYEILADHLGITESQVIQKMTEIDRRDGQTNGRMNPMPATCPKCGRSTNTSRKKCMHCGAAITEGHLFQKS